MKTFTALVMHSSPVSSAVYCYARTPHAASPHTSTLTTPQISTEWEFRLPSATCPSQQMSRNCIQAWRGPGCSEAFMRLSLQFCVSCMLAHSDDCEGSVATAKPSLRLDAVSTVTAAVQDVMHVLECQQCLFCAASQPALPPAPSFNATSPVQCHHMSSACSI